MVDVGIIGSGIIGLSIARELAGRGLSVRVLSREPARATTSWAASGIFPPALDWPDASPGERLTALSTRLHGQWRDELLEETGIDNGLAACGGMYLAVHDAGRERLEQDAELWRARGCRVEWLATEAIAGREPELATAASSGLIRAAMHLPEESQIRPPRHLQALEASCRQRGVEIVTDADLESVVCDGERITAVKSRAESYAAGSWILAGGAWSHTCADAFGGCVRPRPVRGQIVLLRTAQPLLSHVINVGLEYLVPRPDGRVLVGSTLEDAGFELGTTPPAINRMLQFAHRLVPALTTAEVETTWSGIRPGSPDGLPWIGRSPTAANGYVATGHFRAGWHQSTGTAQLLADLITGAEPPLDLAPFAVDRSISGDDTTLATMQRAANDMAAIRWG